MQEVPEVNASLFREVRYGETVTIDPMKWVMEQFTAGRKRNPYWSKCDTMDIAWWLSQPWCELCCILGGAWTDDAHYFKIAVRVPVSKITAYGTPGYDDLPYLDMRVRRKDRKAIPPISKPDLCPSPISLCPGDYEQHPPTLHEIAYHLCLTGTLVVNAYRTTDYTEHCFVVREDDIENDHRFVRYCIIVRRPLSLYRDAAQWKAEQNENLMSPKGLDAHRSQTGVDILPHGHPGISREHE